jgi:hypothetical protein
MSMSKFTTAQVSMLAKKSNGGVIPRFEGEWYMLEQSGKKKLYDFGGKKKGNETLMATALREFEEESGLTLDNITRVHDVFCSRTYGVIVADVDKEPVAVEPGSTIVRMENYSSGEVNGRLYITDLERGMRAVEAAEDAEFVTTGATSDNHCGFIFDDE